VSHRSRDQQQQQLARSMPAAPRVKLLCQQRLQLGSTRKVERGIMPRERNTHPSPLLALLLWQASVIAIASTCAVSGTHVITSAAGHATMRGPPNRLPAPLAAAACSATSTSPSGRWCWTLSRAHTCLTSARTRAASPRSRSAVEPQCKH
jgi:hypothetical protein